MRLSWSCDLVDHMISVKGDEQVDTSHGQLQGYTGGRDKKNQLIHDLY